MNKLRFCLIVLIGLVSASVNAQSQYGNKVVVVPLMGEESTWRGSWQVDTNYSKAEVIEEGGSSYIAVKSHTSSLANMPPDTEYWNLVAASGATGAQGIQGLKGDKGDKGDIGDTGLKGDKGDKGDTGDTGLKGDKGDKGDTGDTGPKGDKGDKGDTGDTGLKGDKGDKGDTGDTGLKGDKGDKGDTGDTGLKGDKGDKGDPGAIGPQGIQGPAGADGADGTIISVDETTIFETIPDAANPNEKTLSGIVYSAGSRIQITTPDANLPAQKVIAFNPSGLTARTSSAVNIRDPWLGVNYIIATLGVFPSRSGADAYIAEIVMFGGNFAPRGWAFCHGQLLPVAQNTALFSLIGTTYGGDGRTTFALPDLRGRSPIGAGSGPGLTTISAGQKGGAETINLALPVQ
ncbi:hypothetical protein GCM10008090_12720 [Arenicella chitinivorans]|uniref:Phage tail collar domain-containing protein n=1 Tax=Arenicella chitinivorans TaxID=1329800 RepID=A0A918RNS6_9GAMM|nr:tail fiber protein [Arenicella chitinivorans]GHA04739.1 hypothetical protein GCM10008090_12720 [Arenicella chitinivorans]